MATTNAKWARDCLLGANFTFCEA